MKKLFFTLIFMLSSIFAYCLTSSDLSGDYKLILSFNQDIPQIVEFDITMQNTGIYYIYEKRIIGNTVWNYPIIVDTFYIDGDDKVILNAGSDKVIMIYTNGVLTGFLYGSNVAVTIAKEVIGSFPCVTNIIELDTNGEIPSSLNKARFLITTNKKTCNYYPSVKNADIHSYKYFETGDSILTIDTSDTSSSSLITINVGGTIFQIVKD